MLGTLPYTKYPIYLWRGRAFPRMTGYIAKDLILAFTKGTNYLTNLKKKDALLLHSNKTYLNLIFENN